MSLLNIDASTSCTADDYWNLPDGTRAELIGGKLYDIAPPSYTHQVIVSGLVRELGNYVASAGGPCRVIPAPFAVNLHADDSTYVEPDVSVICDPAKLSERGCEGAPDLVVEVVSPSSQKRDYFTKCSLYETAGVHEYWIVDPASSQTTVCRFDAETGPLAMYSFDEPVPVGIWDDAVSITVADLLN
ncbi:MAG: Uma2 family endonuclease [Coriobacteriia bacterium]|nr:Uma2 family endonuclease [Coriobacteriia bacterium]